AQKLLSSGTDVNDSTQRVEDDPALVDVLLGDLCRNLSIGLQPVMSGKSGERLLHGLDPHCNPPAFLVPPYAAWTSLTTFAKVVPTPPGGVGQTIPRLGNETTPTAV